MKPKRPTAACLLAAHPAALREMRRALSGGKFEIHTALISFESEPRCPGGRADVYVLDIEGPRPMIARIVTELSRSHPAAYVIAVGTTFSEATAFPLLRKGVRGMVEHEALDRQLEQAIETVGAGGYWVPRIMLSNFVSAIISRSAHPTMNRFDLDLSKREAEVLDTLLENLSNKEIAGKLGISERTVKFHVSNVLRKFGVRRRADLILLGIQRSRASGE